jgi:hypothetical protein
VKQFILVFTTLILGVTSIAQDSTSRRSEKADRRNEKRQRIASMVKQEEEGVLSYTKQNVMGVQLRTNGYGVFFEKGIRRSPRWTNLYTLELSEIKSRKEEKLGSTESFFGNSFIYGKINNFYQGKLGYGQQYIFGQKGNKNGVAVTGSAVAGISIGMLRPYYLQVLDSTGRENQIKYEDDSLTFMGGPILGGGGLGKGWGEMKINPGAFAKVALRFDFGRYNESVQAMEIGFSTEFYAKEVLIMNYNPRKHLFYQMHIAFVFGRRK